MTVAYILRSPGTGHSIEEIVGALRRSMPAHIDTTVVQVPHISRSLRTLWQNLRFVARWYSVQTPGSIVHLTGDVHYLALGLPASKTILTIHDCILLKRYKPLSVRHLFFWLFWYYLPMRRAAVVATVSEKTRQELRRYVGKAASKAQVIPNGYDPVFTFGPQPFNELCPTLLHIGTAGHKNLSRVMQAIAGLSCRLFIVGPLSAEQSDELSRLQIDYENYVDSSRDEIVTLYNRCDIVMFVSLYEGFGMPVLEAQAVGRPVIVSHYRPMVDIAGTDSACFVDPVDIVSIREGVLRVWQDEPYRNQLIRVGQRNAEEYTTERMTVRYVTLYEKLCY